MTGTNVHQRLNAIMADVKGVEKGSTNKHDGYKYAGHQEVNDAIRDAFVKHGVTQTVSITRTQVLEGCNVQIDAVVTWASTDDPSSKVEMGTSAIQPPRSPKQPSLTAQQVGQAISYAVKCVQFKGLMLRGDNEPDADEGAQGSDETDNQGALPDASTEFLARFGTCQTTTEVQSLNEEIKKNWAELKKVRGFAEQMVLARTKAYERVKGS